MRCFINVFKADLKRFWNIAWKLYNTNIVLLMVLCTLSLITACIIILLVSYVFNSVFGFIINLLLFIFSICYMKWFGFYNYMMMYRIPHVYDRWYFGALLMLGIDVGIMAAGIIYFL